MNLAGCARGMALRAWKVNPFGVHSVVLRGLLRAPHNAFPALRAGAMGEDTCATQPKGYRHEKNRS